VRVYVTDAAYETCEQFERRPGTTGVCTYATCRRLSVLARSRKNALTETDGPVRVAATRDTRRTVQLYTRVPYILEIRRRISSPGGGWVLGGENKRRTLCPISRVTIREIPRGPYTPLRPSGRVSYIITEFLQPCPRGPLILRG